MSRDVFGGTPDTLGPVEGDLTGTWPDVSLGAEVVTAEKIADGAVTAAKIAAGIIGGIAGTPSLRALGTGGLEAAAGNDARFPLSGSGSPNGAVSASPGRLYVNTAGGSATTLWVKESGVATNTGWVGK